MPRTSLPSSAPGTLHEIARTRFAVALLIIVAPACMSCGGDKVTPTSPSPSTTVVSSTVKGVAINGNVALTSIGETAQLTATATLNDGTSRDVTKSGTWQSGGKGTIVTIDQNGILTAVGFGATWISFNYQTFAAAGKSVTVTPAGTFVIAGRVREPGAGGLANATVIETLSGRSFTADSSGEFSAAELLRRDAHFRFEQAGYEPAELDAVADLYADLAVQRVVRVVAGEVAAALPLAPNDLRYTVDGNSCVDCRMIRVVVPQAGLVHVRVTWASPTPRLTLFAGGQVFKATTTTRELIADVPANAPDEMLMYLGAAPPDMVTSHTPFVFETSLR